MRSASAAAATTAPELPLYCSDTASLSEPAAACALLLLRLPVLLLGRRRLREAESAAAAAASGTAAAASVAAASGCSPSGFATTRTSVCRRCLLLDAEPVPLLLWSAAAGAPVGPHNQHHLQRLPPQLLLLPVEVFLLRLP